LYSDRHGIFEAHKKGQIDYAGKTQFSRALAELDIDLIKARSPQAKGRVERSFGTAQDRWVKELRLAKVETIDQANEVLERLLPDHNERFNVPAADAGDAHRALGSGHHLAAILSIQETRVVANDYTIRFENRLYQLNKPIYPGERGGKVIIELRLDGTMAIRFGNRYLKYQEIVARPAVRDSSAVGVTRNESSCVGSALPGLGQEMPGKSKKDEASANEAPPSGVKPTNGRSGRTPAEPYPPDGEKKPTKKGPHRPSATHPWRKGWPKRTR
jgi:hypothetical protein